MVARYLRPKIGSHMRLIRAALVVATGALAPVLLLPATSFAATAAPVPVTTAALSDAGSDSPYDSMSLDDLRVAILRIVADPSTGKGVYREAQKALDGTVEDARNFLKTGRWTAQAEDNRVAVVRILADPATGKGVYREAQKALDGTDADISKFLTSGLRLARAEDDRVAVFRILAKPNISKALRAAAEKVVEGTPEELRYFVTVGQYQVKG